jgi:hypothetical protein
MALVLLTCTAWQMLRLVCSAHSLLGTRSLSRSILHNLVFIRIL